MKWILCILMFIVIQSHAQKIDLKLIAIIESNNNPKAWNKSDGGSRGLYQISPICLKDYNKINKTKYKLNDLFNPVINKKIALWMFEIRIPQLLSRYNKPSTLENRIICYNAGITYVTKNKTLPKTTVEYIRKYKELLLPK
jgi:soluble lytic murein transglycosylase-like protein